MGLDKLVHSSMGFGIIRFVTVMFLAGLGYVECGIIRSMPCWVWGQQVKAAFGLTALGLATLGSVLSGSVMLGLPVLDLTISGL